MPIIVITCNEKDSRTGIAKLVVSHGVDLNTGKNHVLPSEHPTELGAKFDSRLGEWLLEGEGE